jgi:nitroreductase
MKRICLQEVVMENGVVKLLTQRHATRSISPEKLPPEILDELMEAIRLTPSCFNKQPWRYLFLESDEARQKAAAALAEGNRPWASRAPLLVVGFAREQDDCVLPDRAYYQFDLGLSAMNLMLAATQRNLVARPMAGFDPEKVRQAFGLEAHQEPLIVLAIGKPSDDLNHLPDYARDLAGKPRERRPASETVRRL